MSSPKSTRSRSLRAPQRSAFRYDDHSHADKDDGSASSEEPTTTSRSPLSPGPSRTRGPRKAKTPKDKFGDVALDTYDENSDGEREPRDYRCVTNSIPDAPCPFPGSQWCEWVCIRCATGTRKQPCVAIDGRYDACAKCLHAKSPGTCSWKVWKPTDRRFHPLPDGTQLARGGNKGEHAYWYSFFGRGPRSVKWHHSMASLSLDPHDAPQTAPQRTAPGFAKPARPSRPRPTAPARAQPAAPDAEKELFRISPFAFEFAPAPVLPPARRATVSTDVAALFRFPSIEFTPLSKGASMSGRPPIEREKEASESTGHDGDAIRTSVAGLFSLPMIPPIRFLRDGSQ